MKYVLVPLCLCAALAAGQLGPAGDGDDKTLSPYFFVPGEEAGADRLPLLSTSADVAIAGVIADVTVTQVYKNDGKRPIEAIYIFPASTRAAVYAMEMRIGDRTIVADIREREQARLDYEQARDAGQSASLLEQQRPNVFQMSVANVMPGDRIEVELKYTELLVPTDGVYQFVYPTVVGPRYSNTPDATASPSERWVENPYHHAGEAPTYDFGLELSLSAGMPIQDMRSPSHRVDIEYDGPAFATVGLADAEARGGDRDFILEYRLSGGSVETGLLLFRGEDENFFLTMVQPPERVAAAEIPPREYIFVVDVSGSMYGFPLDISKELLRDLIGNLRKTDRFNVLLFAGGNTVMAEKSLAATPENIAHAIDVIDNQQGGGGTELLPALRRALALPRAGGTSRTVVIVTDGYVTVETEAFDLIRSSLGDANMFAFGIGSGVNRFIIEGMARVGMGEPFVVTDPSEASARAARFREYIRSPVLTGVKAEFRGFEVYDVEPLAIPDVLADRPILVFGKWRGRPAGSITISGETGRGDYSETIEGARRAPQVSNSALRYLWARHRITLLSDYNKLVEDDERIIEVTELGLRYNLLTQYTSFVAIDSRVRNNTGDAEVVKQPQPLPRGVSDYAVGGYAGTGASLGGLMGQSKKYSRAAAPVTANRMMCEAAADEELLDGDATGWYSGETAERGPTVEIGAVTVDGTVAQLRVSRAVEEILGDIRELYADALDSRPGLKGEMLLKLVIRPDGGIARVQVVKNELDRVIQAGVTRLMAGLSIPQTSGKEATAYVPLAFIP